MKISKNIKYTSLCFFVSLFYFFFVSITTALSQSVDYRVIFGTDWEKALVFEKENRSWMEPILLKNDISYPVAIAVIFPELVRYSALRDKMEITLLKTLYVNLGEEYANFSIGQFQMKPSFAVKVIGSAKGIIRRQSGITFKEESDFKNIIDFRKSIVNDLENTKSEFNYLVAFLKICERKYKISRMIEDEKIRFLATAYNYGFDKEIDQIMSMSYKKFFNTKLFKTENYSYAEVSLFWYEQYLAR